ncbi:salicylic acid-binding protein 2-like isoform X1 [Salvia miltiorrhiza]|uniref:salicylic acid-binding protein 2-like isoform X1 n=1 Tax=Salvia miltiorrhiza TaxID=226208 RepID=UPI0025AD1414|nr:salicylic acid-binding protein 2-like isoform X1 [Salvia miltiorrhiza]
MSKHIVLVHGACHGAWCWYKLKPLLEAAGHRVTALDLAASGIDRRSLRELRTLADYSQPLLEMMAAIPAEEKVVVVGHSLGGMNISLAMEMYPHKISVAIFLAAFMPDHTHPPSYVLDQYNERTPAEEWLDTEFLPYGSPEENLTSMFFGPNFLTSKLYQLSSLEDLELAKMLIRPSSLFLEDLSKRKPFTKQGYGSVKRVYAVCTEDKGIPVNFQRWQIETNGVDEVKVLENIDHMAMLSKPQDVCHCILEIANIYA